MHASRVFGLAIVAAIGLKGVSGQTCPDNVVGTCSNNTGCQAYRGNKDNMVCTRCKEGHTRNPSNGRCVPCDVLGCGYCSSPNVCESCTNQKMLRTNNGTCSNASCPAGCMDCETGSQGCRCWPCGKRFKPMWGDTLISLAARCATNPDAIKGLNPRLENLGNTAPLGGVDVIKMPSKSCEVAIAGDITQCPLGSFWLSCAGSVHCPTSGTLEVSSGVSYGCVDLNTCLSLYDDCLTANVDCPNCCFSRDCMGTGSNSGPRETWYFMTFADGTAHCDPWGRPAG